jgi:peroxin-7
MEGSYEQFGLIIVRSWDQTIKLWDPLRGGQSIRTFAEHRYCVYSTIWSPYNSDQFASASGDRTLKLWDVRSKYRHASLFSL